MNKLYPIDYVTYYDSSGKLPSEVRKSMRETKKKGFIFLGSHIVIMCHMK